MDFIIIMPGCGIKVIQAFKHRNHRLPIRNVWYLEYWASTEENMGERKIAQSSNPKLRAQIRWATGAIVEPMMVSDLEAFIVFPGKIIPNSDYEYLDNHVFIGDEEYR